MGKKKKIVMYKRLSGLFCLEMDDADLIGTKTKKKLRAPCLPALMMKEVLYFSPRETGMEWSVVNQGLVWLEYWFFGARHISGCRRYHERGDGRKRRMNFGSLALSGLGFS